MAVSNFHSVFENFWRGFNCSIVQVFRREALERTLCKPSAIACWGDNPKLQKAILTIRMAAKPGDNYEDVAARIEKEANCYRKFLQNPTPIGKISLNVKQLPSESDDNVFTCSKYQVREPAEGQASVFYTIQRSNRLVLEFVVHDEKDNPLFPITRTYSDWVGKKKFDLGLDRTFHLHMTEGHMPEFVRVQAGFKLIEPDEIEATEIGDELELEPMAASVAKADELENQTDVVTASQGRRLAFAFGFEHLVILLGCCLLFWLTASNLPPRAGYARALSFNKAAPATEYTMTGELAHEVGDDAKDVPVEIVEQRLKEKNNLAERNSSHVKRLHSRANHLHQTARMAEIKQLGVTTDGSSCDSTGSGCKEMLVSFQKAIETDLSRLDVPTSQFNQSEAGEGYAKLVVSYKPVDACLGHVYVTLFDRTGLLLWGREKDCYKFGQGNADSFIAASSESFVKQLVLDIKLAKEEMNSDAKENKTEPADKGEDSFSTD